MFRSSKDGEDGVPFLIDDFREVDAHSVLPAELGEALTKVLRVAEVVGILDTHEANVDLRAILWRKARRPRRKFTEAKHPHEFECAIYGTTAQARCRPVAERSVAGARNVRRRRFGPRCERDRDGLRRR
jgi:hypothetical protein